MSSTFTTLRSALAFSFYKKLSYALAFLFALTNIPSAFAQSITVQGIAYQSSGANISSHDATNTDISFYHATECPAGCDTVTSTVAVRNGAFSVNLTPSQATQDLMSDRPG